MAKSSSSDKECHCVGFYESRVCALHPVSQNQMYYQETRHFTLKKRKAGCSSGVGVRNPCSDALFLDTTVTAWGPLPHVFTLLYFHFQPTIKN